MPQDLTNSQLIARHNSLITEGRSAQARGDRDEAYRIAQEIRRSTAEMRLRMAAA